MVDHIAKIAVALLRGVRSWVKYVCQIASMPKTAHLYSSKHDGRRCEASPGPIAPEELLALGLYSPDIFDASTNQLKVEAIKLNVLLGNSTGHEDICGQSSGLSLGRIEKPGSEKELRNALQQISDNRVRQGKPATVIEGYSTVTATTLEAIENGSLFVIDDGCECYRSHAVIRAKQGMSRSSLRGPRDQLLKKLNEKIRRGAI